MIIKMMNLLNYYKALPYKSTNQIIDPHMGLVFFHLLQVTLLAKWRALKEPDATS